MKYIATKDISVNCIYGTYTLKVGEEIPSFIAKKFPQHIQVIEDVINEEPIKETEETKNEKKKG